MKGVMKKTVFALVLTLAAVAAAQGVSVLEKGWKGTEVTVEAKAAEKKVEDGEKLEAKEKKSRPVKITSDSTVYNRKEGVACFRGNVFVDDEQYQLHAERVFVMMEGTNELKRIVAVGNVAMTNEMRRAYGHKVTYSRKNGLVVLYSGEGITAEVRDEGKEGDQVVRGGKIRFWIDSEQVEVDEADITAPASAGGGANSLKKVIGR